LVRRVEEQLHVRFSVVFGTTECSPLLTQARLDDSGEDRAGTLGRALPHTEIRISDLATGEPVPVGAVGELCTRGYLVMAGYNDNPEGTARAIDADGWYHTGDLASMDARGYLHIAGRATDMIIRGGENIYPREIEDVLFAHSDVADVAVLGVPDEVWGELVVAYLRLHDGSTISEVELRAYCREHLAPYKTPAHWRFVEAFPLTPSGKVQKYKLREQFAASEGTP
jgi:acyl-CoA synthetase (AMP-forming)/AMP-acid ligase II